MRRKSHVSYGPCPMSAIARGVVSGIPLRPALVLALSTARTVRSVAGGGAGSSWLNHGVVGAE
jgi:hypothetical protein